MAASFYGLYLMRWRTSIKLLMAAAAILVATATMYGDFSPWRLLVREWLPGAGAIRALWRISMLLLLPATIGFGMATQQLAIKKLFIPAVLLVLLCVGEQASVAPWIDKRLERQHISRISQKVAPDCKAFFLVCTEISSCKSSLLDGMWVNLKTGIPTANGRYGHFPPDYDALTNTKAASAEDIHLIKAALRDWELQHNLEIGTICLIESSGYKKPPKDSRIKWPSRSGLKKCVKLFLSRID